MASYGCAAPRTSAGSCEFHRHEVFRVIGGQLPSLNLLDEGSLIAGWEASHSIEVPLRNATGRVLARKLLNGGVEIEKGEDLRNFTLGFAGGPRNLFLRVAGGVSESCECIGKVVRVHAETLPVLDDSVDEDIFLLGRLDPAGDFSKACVFGGLLTVLTGDDLVEILRFEEADGNGLEDAVLFHGGDKFALGSGIQSFSGLQRTWADTVNPNGKGAADAAAPVQGPGIRRRIVAKRQLGRSREC
jgi:hypothetical protein